MISSIYNTLLYHPLLNALIFIYNNLSFNSLGLAVIILTIIIRVILFPLFHKSSKSQAVMQRIQPQVKELTEKFKNNREEQVKRIMELYKEHKINPFSSIFLLFIQLPVLIALFHVFYRGLGPDVLANLYSFVVTPTIINFNFLNLINLQEPFIILVVLASITQYFQGRLSLPKATPGQTTSTSERLGRQMMYIGPIISFVILFNLPAVISIYWITTSVFSIFQQLIINRSLKDYKNESHQTNIGTST